ncbi:MAG: hypothetical protein RRC07_06275, partial [Anaerolineae bacterium]|nr:hypothetical protein [Anaerolineae bacterium]
AEQPVAVYGGPEGGQPLVAYLAGWADVQRLGESWHEILFPTGGSGWVKADSIHLSVGCGQSGPLRLELPAGTSSQMIEGKMPAAAQIAFVFWAGGGQVATIRVSSPENSVLFHLEGTGNGQVYKQLLDGESEWESTLDRDQEYLLTLDNVGPAAATYTVELGLQD